MTYHRRPTISTRATTRRPRGTGAARTRGLPSMPDYSDSAYYWFHEAIRSRASRPVNTDTAPRRQRARPSPAESDTEAGTRSTGIGGYLLVAALVILVLVGGGSWLGSALTSTLSTPASAGTTYSLGGSPTVNADFINRVLVRYHSPAIGEGQTVYDDSVKYGIDPVFALAFFMHESSFGATGEASSSLSIGNLRCLGAGYEDLHPSCRDNFAWFSSWDDGIEAWYRLIKIGYVQGGINAFIGRNACPCVTIAQIIPVYAPRSDHNDEAAYIAAVEREVDTWRRGEVWVG
jgi:Mannosyl-glycoprotein endo-beta-N-acetylglucosaminidase